MIFKVWWKLIIVDLEEIYNLGTAAVVLAGLIAALRITNKKWCENTYLFVDAGQVHTHTELHSFDSHYFIDYRQSVV